MKREIAWMNVSIKSEVKDSHRDDSGSFIREGVKRVRHAEVTSCL